MEPKLFFFCSVSDKSSKHCPFILEQKIFLVFNVLRKRQTYLNFTYFEQVSSSAGLFLPLFRAVTSLLSLAASIFRKSSSVSNCIWLIWAACWILSTCSLSPSVAASIPVAYYDSSYRKRTILHLRSQKLIFIQQSHKHNHND